MTSSVCFVTTKPLWWLKIDVVPIGIAKQTPWPKQLENTVNQIKHCHTHAIRKN